jgi:hypothetical protein
MSGVRQVGVVIRRARALLYGMLAGCGVMVVPFRFGAVMDLRFPRPMLNSPAREGTADTELFVKRVLTRLDAAHEANYMVGYLMNLARDFWLRERNQAAARHST